MGSELTLEALGCAEADGKVCRVYPAFVICCLVDASRRRHGRRDVLSRRNLIFHGFHFAPSELNDRIQGTPE
jgi:hypothetical protein